MSNRDRQYNVQQRQTIQWPTETDNTMSNRDRQYNVQQRQTIQWPTETDNTMSNRDRQYNGQQRQTIQWPTEKGHNNDLQHTKPNTKDSAPRTPLKTVGELRYSGMVSSSCPNSSEHLFLMYRASKKLRVVQIPITRGFHKD